MCTLPVRLLCGCTVLCACWWLGGANGGGSIKWCCEKTRQKEQGTTAQNPIFTSPLHIKLYPRPPPTPFHSPTHSPASKYPHHMQDKEGTKDKWNKIWISKIGTLRNTNCLQRIISYKFYVYNPKLNFVIYFIFIQYLLVSFFCIKKKSAKRYQKTGNVSMRRWKKLAEVIREGLKGSWR